MTIAVVLLALVLFTAAGVLGFRYHQARVWHWIDVVYYPLAATGIALLFWNNTTERRLLDVGEEIKRHHAEYEALLEARPSVTHLPSDQTALGGWRLLEVVSDLGAACHRLPSDFGARCTVARRLKPPLDTFLEAGRTASKLTPEMRVLTTCAAARDLLTTIRKEEVYSSSTSEKLIAEYRAAIDKGYVPYGYGGFVSEADAFRQRLLADLDAQRGLFPDDDVGRQVLAVLQEEADSARSVLLGLFPCVAAPTKDLERLDEWTATERASRDQGAEIDQELNRLNAGADRDPRLNWLLLNLWPLILILAVSSKFGKSVAGLRKASPGSSEPKPKPEPEPEPEPTATPASESQVESPRDEQKVE